MKSAIKRFFKRLHHDTSGAMSVEKILIIALISLPIVIVLLMFKSKLIQWFTENSNQLNNNP